MNLVPMEEEIVNQEWKDGGTIASQKIRKMETQWIGCHQRGHIVVIAVFELSEAFKRLTNEKRIIRENDAFKRRIMRRMILEINKYLFGVTDKNRVVVDTEHGELDLRKHDTYA